MCVHCYLGVFTLICVSSDAAADAQETLFKDYRIESNNNNEIWLEISLDSLLKILRSADNSGG